jgi:hypothetical protein
MGHPVLDAIIRCKGPDHCRLEVFREWQRVLRDEVQPQLDELHVLRAAPDADVVSAADRRRGRA